MQELSIIGLPIRRVAHFVLIRKHLLGLSTITSTRKLWALESTLGPAIPGSASLTRAALRSCFAILSEIFRINDMAGEANAQYHRNFLRATASVVTTRVSVRANE